jgi:hypothetical protein
VVLNPGSRLGLNRREFCSCSQIQVLGGPQGTLYDRLSMREVVVTAQKREERLVDVPIAVAEMLDDYVKSPKIHQLWDLSDRVPDLPVASAAPKSRSFCSYSRPAALLAKRIVSFDCPNRLES